MGRVDVELAREILRYFLRNPQAIDTQQGIARWRLLDQAIHHQMQQVSQAMEWLVTEGFLVRVPTTAPEDAVFRLNRERTEQTREFVEGKAEERRKAPGPKRLRRE